MRLRSIGPWYSAELIGLGPNSSTAFLAGVPTPRPLTAQAGPAPWAKASLAPGTGSGRGDLANQAMTFRLPVSLHAVNNAAGDRGQPGSGDGCMMPVCRPRSPAKATAMVLRLPGRIDRADIPYLCDRLRVLVRDHVPRARDIEHLDSGDAMGVQESGWEVGADAGWVVCDVSALTAPDAATVEALARLQLTARRLGCRIWLRGACPRLRELLALVGLGDVVPLLPPASGVELERQAEQREPTGDVQERVEPDDPPL